MPNKEDSLDESLDELVLGPQTFNNSRVTVTSVSINDIPHADLPETTGAAAVYNYAATAEPEDEPDPEEIKILFKDSVPCAYCGCFHSIKCPRVKRIVFKDNSDAPREVEFFAWDEWPHGPHDQIIIWPEDVV